VSEPTKPSLLLALLLTEASSSLSLSQMLMELGQFSIHISPFGAEEDGRSRHP
jgi:hypothetical protein